MGANSNPTRKVVTRMQEIYQVWYNQLIGGEHAFDINRPCDLYFVSAVFHFLGLPGN
jgi:hypothetical protein